MARATQEYLLEIKTRALGGGANVALRCDDHLPQYPRI